jgi:hypothetical protein
MGTPGFANSARVRCAIYSRDTAIRIYIVSRLRRKNPFVKISSWAKVMGFASQNIFPDPFLNMFSKYGHILGKAQGAWRMRNF